MGVELQVQGDKLVAYLSGEIDHHNSGALREAIDSKAGQMEPTELILDFSRVTFMDSAGIGLILGRYRWMQNLGGGVRITHIAPHMEQLLVLSGIHRLVQVESSASDGMEDGAYDPEEKGDMNSREIFSDSSKEVNFYAK